MLGWIVFSAFEPYKRIDLEQITLTDFIYNRINTQKKCDTECKFLRKIHFFRDPLNYWQ